MSEKQWCIDKCAESGKKVFSEAKMEAFAERVAIKVEAGQNPTVAREETFFYYTK